MLQIWTDKRSEARVNEYSSPCAACVGTVAPHDGTLVSKPDSTGAAIRNRALHPACELPDGWYWRAAMGTGGTTIGIVKQRLGQGLTIIGEASPMPTPEPEPVHEPTEAELMTVASKLLKDNTDAFLTLVPDLVRSTLLDLTRTVNIKLPKAPVVKIDNAHRALADVVMTVAAGTHPFLVGPAGSGKTTLASQVCDVLKRKFYAENRVTSEYKLLGYMDATGKYIRTQFREAYEKGGGFLLDEVDASDPDVLTTFNSALANGICPFPDKMIKAHKDFFAIAAGNTYGRGADRQYVGRNQLDAATLDRFVVIEIDYDESAEMAWATDADWTLYVQQVRRAVATEKVRHIVSPRASIFGSRLLAAGMERSLVEERCIWKGLEDAQKARIVARLGMAS